MKKWNFLVLLLLGMVLPTLVEAAPVKVERAKAKAEAFFGATSATRSAAQLELVWSGGDQTASRSGEEPALYLFNRTDRPGFVLMAGDDAAAPVLGYSFEHSTGDVEQMPAHIRWYLDGLRDMVLALRASGAAPDAAWSEAPKAGTPIRELKTALWNQGAPYNNECPTLSNGDRAVTGCVQTAAGILIHYNGWPTEVSGTVPGFISEPHKFSMPARELKPYNHDLLLESYVSGQYTDEQAAEVARLMVDLGTMNHAQYDTETGAYEFRLRWALGEYMRYNKQSRLESRASHSDKQWTNLLKKELDAGRPLIYSGYDEKGGHCFICDGYDSENYFRFNWGWGGSSNGYFLVENLAPNSTYNFTQGQTIIADLTPDKEGTTVHSDNLVLFDYKYGGYFNGLQVNTDQIARNVPFTASASFGNLSSLAYNGKIAFATFTTAGQLKELVSQEITDVSFPAAISTTEDAGSYYVGSVSSVPCTVKQEIAPGDRLRVAFWENSKQAWHPMGASGDGVPYEVVLMPEEPDAEAVAAGTKVAYNRTTKTLTVTTFNSVKVTLKNGSGSVVKEQTSDGTPIAIDASTWAKGTYTLTLQYGSATPYTCNLVL